MLHFVLVQNQQGKARLAKYYVRYDDAEKKQLLGEVYRIVAQRNQRSQSNFVEFRHGTKIVYQRYAGLYFSVCVDMHDNELMYFEAIHLFVEILNAYFTNV